MNPSSATRPRLTDRVRREWYIVKVDFLAQDVPGGYPPFSSTPGSA